MRKNNKFKIGQLVTTTENNKEIKAEVIFVSGNGIEGDYVTLLIEGVEVSTAINYENGFYAYYNAMEYSTNMGSCPAFWAGFELV